MDNIILIIIIILVALVFTEPEKRRKKNGKITNADKKSASTISQEPKS